MEMIIIRLQSRRSERRRFQVDGRLILMLHVLALHIFDRRGIS
jgi:hypothetical protein